MAISLNDHETRIKKLEESGVSTWQKGSNSNGYWAKETTTGLIIQWGKTGSVTAHNGTITFPIAFTSTPVILSLGLGDRVGEGADGAPGIRAIGTSTARTTTGTTSLTVRVWIAIGYLISDRILNYIYKAFAIIFTLIFGIRLVSKFTV